MSRIYETAIRIAAKVDANFKTSTLAAAKAIEQVAKQEQKLAAAEKAIASATGLTRLRVEAQKLAAASAGAAAFEKVTAAVAAARAKYDTAATALARLNAAEKAAGGATKESTKWRKAGERATASAEKELTRATKAAGLHAAALHAAGVDTNKLASEQVRLATALAVTERRTAALATVEKARTRLFGERKDGFLGLFEKDKRPLIEKAGAQIKSIAGDALKLGGLAAAAAGGMFALARSTGDAGAEIEHTAIRLGTTTDALQLLRSAGRKSGVEIDALDTGLGKMAINIGKVASAKKKGGGGGLTGEVGGIQMLGMPGAAKAGQVDPFKHLGLSAKELAKLAPEEQVAKIADGIAKLKTHAEQSAAAVQIFGKGGLAMLPLILKGSVGINELFAQAKASGNILSRETIENSRRFHIAFLGAGAAVKSVKNVLGAALLPVVTSVLGKFTKYVQDNREKIKAWAELVAKWIETKAIPALLKLGPQVLDLARKLGALIQKGADLVGGFKNLGMAAAALRLAPLALTIGQIGVAAIRAGVGLAGYVTAKWRAVAATKALNEAEAAGAGNLGAAMGGGTGAAGKAIGLAASAAMVASAGLIGWQIGTAIDEKFGLSDKLAGGKGSAEDAGSGRLLVAAALLAPLTGGVSLIAAGIAKHYRDKAIAEEKAGVATNAGKLAEVKRLQGQGYSYDAASAAVFRGQQGPPMPRTGGGKVLDFRPNITVQPVSREDLERQLDESNDKAKQQALDAYDARESDRRRVSFG